MKVTKLHGMGNHLMFDGFSNGDLSNKKFIETFLKDLTKKIKMKSISKPLVIDYKSKDKEESGITGTIILAESNITIHTYPDKKWFCLDIYSCKEFEIPSTIIYLKDSLKVYEFKHKLLRRGF